MKKTSFLFALALISALSFSSCFSFIPYKFKENVSELPANESAVILFDNASTATIILKKWNDNDINKALYGWGFIDNNDRAELTVPAGDNSFTFDIFFQFGDTLYEKRNIELQYNLVAGNKYIVKARTNAIKSGFLIKQREFFIGIYSDVKKSEPLKEWKLGES